MLHDYQERCEELASQLARKTGSDGDCLHDSNLSDTAVHGAYDLEGNSRAFRNRELIDGVVNFERLTHATEMVLEHASDWLQNRIRLHQGVIAAMDPCLSDSTVASSALVRKMALMVPLSPLSSLPSTVQTVVVVWYRVVRALKTAWCTAMGFVLRQAETVKAGDSPKLTSVLGKPSLRSQISDGMENSRLDPPTQIRIAGELQSLVESTGKDRSRKFWLLP